MSEIENAMYYNQLGLIPGPGESRESFFERVDYCLNLKKEIPDSLIQDLPFVKEELNANDIILGEGCNFSKKLYDISPTWVPLFFSNSDLPIWQGGCAWIFQKSESSPRATFFQLRKNFKEKSCFLGIYERKELLAHELCHVGRMQFEEPKFEEIIAYQTANSSFRRLIGPIFTSSLESGLFLLFLILLVIIDFFSFIYDLTSLSTLSYFMHISLTALIACGIARVFLKHYQFDKCLRNLKIILPKNAKAVLYRLRDNEIVLFSKINANKIHDFAKEQQEFRWKVIYNSYFEK